MVEVYLENVTKTFGSVVAVDNVTLKVRDGEFMVLLGPSGCGKTTTLRLIAGLERVTKGRILFGEDLMDDGKFTYVSPRYRRVSMVFQSYALFPHMKVFDNIAFPAYVQRLPKDEIKKRVREVAETLGIGDLLDRKPHELSGGQAQRVALARSLMIRPEVLLLDEPLANLDAKLRVSARAELKRLHVKEFKCTTIYVTHDQVEAFSLADRVAIMDKGRIRQLGTTEDLCNRPKDTFVAGFLGSPSMNLIDCTYNETDGTLDLGPFTIKVPESWRELLRGHTELTFGVRPADISIYKKKEEKGIEFEVYILEPLIDETILTLRREDVIIKTILPPGRRFEIGEKIQVKINMDKAHVFDKKTGEIIL